MAVESEQKLRCGASLPLTPFRFFTFAKSMNLIIDGILFVSLSTINYFFHKVTKTQRIFRENRIFENSYGSNGDRFAIAVRNTAWENSEIPSCSAIMLCRSVVHSLLPFITVLASLFETANRQ